MESNELGVSTPLFGGSANDPVTAQDPISDQWVVRRLGGGEVLFVDSVSVPDRVAPGGIVDVDVTVVNTALAILDDPDKCMAGASAGFEYEVSASFGGAMRDATTKCLQIPLFGTSNRETHQLSVTAPTNAGSYDLTVAVEGTGTGFTGSGTFPILVEGGADDRPDNDPVNGDDPANGDGLAAGAIIALGAVVLLFILLSQVE